MKTPIQTIDNAVNLATEFTAMIREAIPSDELRQKKFEFLLPHLSYNKRIILINKSKRFLKRNKSVEVEDFVRFTCSEFNEQTQRDLIDILAR